MDSAAESGLPTREKVNASLRRLGERLENPERYLAPESGELGWADLVTGMPDGELMDEVMRRVKRRVGEETDIGRNLERIGIDIFSKLEQARTGKGVRLRVLAEAPERYKNRGGFASHETREAVIIAPEGVDRRRYLEWAVDGNVNLVWCFSTGVHETTHTAVMAEWSNRATLAKMGASIACATAGTVELTTGMIFRGEATIPACGLMALGYLLTFAKMKGEREAERTKEAYDGLLSLFDEVGAKLSWEDAGLSEPRGKRELVGHLAKHELYKSDWETLTKEIAEASPSRLVGILERMRGVRADATRRRMVVEAAYRQWGDKDLSGITFGEWEEILESAKTGSEGRKSGFYQEREEYISRESAMMRYLLRDPKHPDEGGHWGEEAEMRQAAMAECAQAEAERFVRTAMDYYRAADALGLTKYEFLQLVTEKARRAKRRAGETGEFLLLVEEVIGERVAETGRGEVSVGHLAREGEMKAEMRHYDLRTIVLEELEKVWKEKKIDPEGMSLTWENRGAYFMKDAAGKMWAIVVDGREGERVVKLVGFDGEMKAEPAGEKVTDFDTLERLAEGFAVGADQELWKLVEEGLESDWWPSSKPADDDRSGGQLQIVFLAKALEEIPHRWGVPEIRSERFWRKYERAFWARIRSVARGEDWEQAVERVEQGGNAGG